MEASTILAVVGGLVGLSGGMCGIISLIFQRRQTRLMQQQVEALRSQVDARRSEEERYTEWSAKLEQAIDALTKTYRGVIYTTRSSPNHGPVLVFPDQEFRQRIERHLGRATLWGKFEATKLSKEQLLNPVVQQLIQEVLESVEKFKREHTDWARELKLLLPE